jgi:hypothetical protein
MYGTSEKSSARRSSSKQYHPKETIPGNIVINEINNHADTKCASPNWRQIEISGKYCTVSTKTRRPDREMCHYVHMPNNWQFGRPAGC